MLFITPFFCSGFFLIIFITFLYIFYTTLKKRPWRQADTFCSAFGYRLRSFRIPPLLLSDAANVFRSFSASQTFHLASLKTARKCLFVAFFGLCVGICRIFRKFPGIFGFFLKCLYFSFIFAFFLLFLQVFCV